MSYLPCALRLRREPRYPSAPRMRTFQPRLRATPSVSTSMRTKMEQRSALSSPGVRARTAIGGTSSIRRPPSGLAQRGTRTPRTQPIHQPGLPARVRPASSRCGWLRDPYPGERRDRLGPAAVGPSVMATLMKPRMAIADPKRKSRRQRQIGPAAVRANTRIRVGMGLIQILDHDVPERLGLSARARQAAHLHDGFDLLREETTPAIGLRLGHDEGVDDRLPIIAQQSDETSRPARSRHEREACRKRPRPRRLASLRER